MRGSFLNKNMKVLALMTLTGSVAVLTQSYAEPSSAAHKTAGAAIDRVGGHPNFSGVWSVMNTANWNIEPHLASAALEVRPGPVVPVPAKAIVALGAVGSVPAGMGVVEGRGPTTCPCRSRSCNPARLF